MWKRSTTNFCVSCTADSLNWPTKYGVKFPGVHCFRRGSCRFVRETEGDDASKLHLGHASANKKGGGSTARYWRDRNNKKAKKEVKSWVVPVSTLTPAERSLRSELVKKEIVRRNAKNGTVLAKFQSKTKGQF